MLSIDEKKNLIDIKILNIQSCITVNAKEIDILKSILPIDQETIDAYLLDIELKRKHILFMEGILNNLNNWIDQIGQSML